MTISNSWRWLAPSLALAGTLIAWGGDARAHCDTMSGPVITAANKALDTGDVNLVLIWVQPDDEAAIRAEFEKARAARQTGGQAKEDADMRFFEALVRIHRAGEGAPYTGIKPAGTDAGPAVEAADQALAAGTVEPVRAVVVNAVEVGIERRLRAVAELKGYEPDDVAAGRAYVAAYVQYMHFAEGLYDKATAVAAYHEHGEAEEHGESEAHGAERGAVHAGHVAKQEGKAAAASSEHPTGRSCDDSHLPWILVVLLGLVVVAETGWIALRRTKSKIQK